MPDSACAVRRGILAGRPLHARLRRIPGIRACCDPIRLDRAGAVRLRRLGPPCRRAHFPARDFRTMVASLPFRPTATFRLKVLPRAIDTVLMRAPRLSIVICKRIRSAENGCSPVSRSPDAGACPPYPIRRKARFDWSDD